MTLLPLAAVLIVTGAVAWYAAARRRPTIHPPPPAPSVSTPSTAERAAGPESVAAAASPLLAVVAVAVEEIDAAANLLGEDLASEARAEVAGALRAAVRRQDLCTPWRDHFVVAVLPGVDREQTPALCQRVQRALSELRIVTHTGDEMSIGFRVASACAPGDGASEADLLAAAEARLARSRPALPTSPDGAHAQLCAALPILSN